MNKKITSKSVRLMATMTAIIVPLAILFWCNQDAVWAFIARTDWIRLVRDRQAVVAYLDQLGFIGPLVLMGLVGLQVLIPSLPAEPPMIAGAYAYGFTAGFLMSWLVSVAVSQAVFYLARYAGRPVVERFVPAELLDRWTRTAGEKGMVFFLLAFVIPPVPSDILIYVAGLSAIDGRRFFVANFFGRVPMIVLLTLVGARGFSITPAMIVGLAIIGVLMLMAWWYFVMRERPDAVAGRSDRSNAGRADCCNDSVPIAPRRSPNHSPNLAREGERCIRPAQGAEAVTHPSQPGGSDHLLLSDGLDQHALSAPAIETRVPAIPAGLRRSAPADQSRTAHGDRHDDLAAHHAQLGELRSASGGRRRCPRRSGCGGSG
jgi:uncharacterized membrane protein YdjX (TVP38/TMEM64 family)